MRSLPEESVAELRKTKAAWHDASSALTRGLSRRGMYGGDLRINGANFVE